MEAEASVPPGAAAGEEAPLTVAGTVAGATRDGQAVVATPAGTLVLQARSDLPVGAPVLLEVGRTPDAAVPAPLDPLRGGDWPALREAMVVLAATDPALARTLLDGVIPQPNKRLTRNLVFFLSALRGGDAGGWLGGGALEALERAGRRDLAGRLAEDFQAASRQAAEPNAEGWRSHVLPFAEAGAVTRLQMAVRRAGEEEAEETGDDPRGRARRFLIDVEFTRLGAMQLDGLVWPGRFDLVVRTAQLLPGELKRELDGIFTGSLQAVGYAGTLSFQTGAHAWVRLQVPQAPSVRA
ncbi:MAG TPA: hypothetical protein VEB20_17315 [Azospirillaceae bacterium]|nr:hypothetical protein [Azospirillaceae bacterium]